jgi:hypothetical protein
MQYVGPQMVPFASYSEYLKALEDNVSNTNFATLLQNNGH